VKRILSIRFCYGDRMTESRASPTMRRDAEANRERLLAAAGELSPSAAWR